MLRVTTLILTTDLCIWTNEIIAVYFWNLRNIQAVFLNSTSKNKACPVPFCF